MPIRKSTPLYWTPTGLADTVDSTIKGTGREEERPGRCQSISELVPDPGTPGTWAPRPAALQLTNFTGFTTPGFVSCAINVGGSIYGMIATGRNAGHDEPFIYNVAGNSFTTVGGTISSATTPTSPATSGAWTPPQMAVVGSKVVVTHTGFPGSGTNFGWFDISNPGSPTWNSGNTTTTALPAVPTGVAQFGNRAYFIEGNALYASDPLNATTITNATQVLTFGGSTSAIMAVVGQPLESTGQGGIIQALLAFKGSTGETGIWQVTGDFAATGGWVVNQLTSNIGCDASRTAVATPQGVYFLSPDGVRNIDLNGNVSDPKHSVQQPFIQVITASRWAAGYTANTYAICGQTGFLVGAPTKTWWYNFTIDEWSGPHSIIFDNAVQDGFRLDLSSSTYAGQLLKSTIIPTGADSYTELGSALNFTMQTANLPDEKRMAEKAMIETMWALSFSGSSGQYNILALDENAAVLGQASITPASGATIWGASTWGSAFWGGAIFSLSPFSVDWSAPIVFKKIALKITGPSLTGLKVGPLTMRWQVLGYRSQAL